MRCKSALCSSFYVNDKRGEIPPHCDVTHLAEFLNCIIQGMSISAREGASLEKLMQIAGTTLRLWPELVK